MSIDTSRTASVTLPRWEWRTFGNYVGQVESGLRETLAAAPVKTTAETYIVGAAANVNVKIRGGLLDVKRLRQIDARGLEQWEPVLKSAFPLETQALHEILRLWHLTARPAIDALATADAFVRRFVSSQPSLAVIDVTKTRRSVPVDGCLVEVAELTFAGSPARTAAVEGVDPDRVWRRVGAFNLSGVGNENYVKALHRFLSNQTPSSHCAAPGRALL